MAHDTLVTSTGHSLPALALKPSLFMDQTTVLYGQSKTGKTFIVKAIMKTLHGHVDEILVVSPTEPSNRSYEGFVDKPMMHYRMWLPDPDNPRKDDGSKGAERFLTAVLNRQDMKATIYSQTNQLPVLRSIYRRIRTAGADRYIRMLERKRDRSVEDLRRRLARDPGQRDEKIKEVTEGFEKMLALVCKKFIAPRLQDLWARNDLTEDEQYSLQYLNFNPRLLIIFDDCAAELKPFFKKEVFRKIFYQGRHSYISAIVCCQDDTDLPTNLRKSAFVSVFTQEVICTSNFERSTNKYSKDTRDYVKEIANEVFSGHRKLVYLREDSKGQNFYHLTAPYTKPFRFGSDALGELCDRVQSSGFAIDKDNPYFDKFRIT